MSHHPPESGRASLQVIELRARLQPTVTCRAQDSERSRNILLLQFTTIAWMLIECGVALVSAWKARSTALFAFGADSFVELLSAGVVLMQYVPRFRIDAVRAARAAGALLIALAVIVAGAAAASIINPRIDPQPTWSGIAISVAALLVMPLLAMAKRKIATATQDRALAADAVQSATCAYLAAVTLAGLALNAIFHIRWIDPFAALAALPVLWSESRRALRGETCGCC
jgi:divalent metal cation (Fe/Co/Zn/Cd) transporter